MTNLAVTDEKSGEVAEAEIVTGVLLGVDRPTPEPVEPTVGPLYHPAPGRVVEVARQRQRRLGYLRTFSHVGRVAISAHNSSSTRDILVVVSAVAAAGGVFIRPGDHRSPPRSSHSG